MREIKPVEVLVEDGRPILVLEDKRRITLGLNLNIGGFTYAIQRADGIAAFELEAADVLRDGHPVEGLLWANLVMLRGQNERIGQLALAVGELAEAMRGLLERMNRPGPSMEDIMAAATKAVAPALANLQGAGAGVKVER